MRLQQDDAPLGGAPGHEEDAGAIAVVRPQKTPAKKRRRKGIPRHNVVLWDDDHHTYEYVIVMLQELFGHPIEKGFQLAQTVDTAGKAVVLTTTKEHAELKRDQIHAYGKDPRMSECKGSMTATIEPAD